MKTSPAIGSMFWEKSDTRGLRNNKACKPNFDDVKTTTPKKRAIAQLTYRISIGENSKKIKYRFKPISEIILGVRLFNLGPVDSEEKSKGE